MSTQPITPAEFTLTNIMSSFATDEQARSFLERWLWPTGPVCPKCKSNNPERVYKMTGKSTRPGLHNCKDCRRQFTVTVGTIFEDSHIPLRKWLIAWYLINASKKGMASLQLQRMLDLGSYRTALFMSHRIRFALSQPEGPKLSGVVEVDETYVGGKSRKGIAGRGSERKTPVVSMVERGGRKRSMVVERLTAKTLHAGIVANVEESATVNTDDFKSYIGLDKKFAAHHTVNHSKGEYARGEVTTNRVEGYFSVMKRGLIGTYHHVSSDHLQRYLNEFDFRFNYRDANKVSDAERTQFALKGISGKRLTYRRISRQA